MAAEPRPARTNVAPLLVAALAGACVGALATRLLLSSEDAPSTSASAAPSAQLSEARTPVAEAELRRLADQVAALSAALESNRESADLAAPPSTEWLAQLEALIAARANATSASSPPPAPGFATLSDLHASIRAELQTALAGEDLEFREARVALEERLDESHRLWPMAKVLSTYGAPSHVATSDLGLLLDYHLEAPSYSDLPEPPRVRFLIQEGVVAEVQFSLER